MGEHDGADVGEALAQAVVLEVLRPPQGDRRGPHLHVLGTSRLVHGQRMGTVLRRPRRRGLQVPRYLLINGTEPRWRLHDTVDSADLEKSLARVMENGVIIYTLASCNEGETFQSLTIDGKSLVRYLITEEADPDPAKTRSRYEAAGF
jgi:hypothetical protein